MTNLFNYVTKIISKKKFFNKVKIITVNSIVANAEKYSGIFSPTRGQRLLLIAASQDQPYPSSRAIECGRVLGVPE